MIVIALGAGVMGWFLPASSFTRTIADTLYCSITSANCSSLYCINTFQGNGNCTAVYCGSGVGNCVATVDGTSQCAATKTNKSTFTSATFTTITTCAWASPANVSPTLGDTIVCTATYDYDTTVATSIAKFQFIEQTQAAMPVKYQLGPSLPLSTNETLAASTTGTLNSGSHTISFQVSVSGAAGTITLGPGAVICFDVFSTGTSQVS